MSGTGANLPINIRVTGTQEAEAAFNRVSTTAGASMQRVQQSTTQATDSSRQFGHVIGQAGFQVQDFATQVQMGQNAVSAFGVQFAQFAGLFGTGGAVAGAVVVAGTLAANMLSIGESAAEAERKIEVAFNAIKADSEGVRDVIKEIGDLYRTAAERAQELARAQSLVLSQNVDLRLSNSIQMQDAAATRIPQLEREIAVLERRAQVEADIARRSSRGGIGAPVDQTTDTTSALFVARSQLSGLRAEMDLMDRRIAQLNQARGDLGRTGSDLGRGEFGPAAPATLEATRAALDREFVLRREHAQRLESINVALAQGNTTAAEAASLRGMAERKLSEDLKALADRQSGATQALREYVNLQRDAGTGLLLGSDSDARAAREIAAQLRPGQQERARQAAETLRDQERTLREQERQNQQVTDSIVRYGADRFADMFAENSRGWAGMLETFRNTARSVFARIAAEAIIRPIIAPIVQGAGLGQVGGIGTGGSSSSGGFSLSSLGSIRTAYDSLSNPGRLGQFFPGGSSVNTGFGGLDGVLNTNVFQGAFPSEAGFQAIVDGTGATTGASFGQLLGPAASIAGGAYGIYSGLNRGGAGGYTSALGGAVSAGTGLAMLGSAAGLLPALGALGPIGLGLGAVLAIAGALLPGQAPSGMGQLARTNLGSGEMSFEGLGGRRFSQGNRDAATNAVGGISQLVQELGDKLGGARLGGNAAVGVTNGTLYLEVASQRAQFANDEAGAKQLSETAARFVLDEFRRQGTVQGDYAGILNASGTQEALAANLKWYEETYKTITKATPAVSAYEKAIEGVWQQFEPAIQKANELGLATEALTKAREDEYRKVYLERERHVAAFDSSTFIRTLRAQGNVYADMLSFDAALPEQLRQARESLEALGLSAEDVSTRIAQVEYAAGLERLNIIKAAKEEENRVAQQAAEAQVQSARSVLDWLNGQSLGALSSLSPTARLAEAERQFNSAFAAGDARSVTGAADALLGASREVFGGATAAYAEREAFVRQSVGQVGLRAAQAGGNGDVVAALGQVIVELRASLESLRAEVAAGNAERRLATTASLAA